MAKKQSRTARFTAIETLCTLYRNRSSVKPVFDLAVHKYGLPARERGLAMQLIYGVLRQRHSLDRIIELQSRTPLHKLDPFVHQALAVGLFQLFFLERIPVSAAVNEVVASCKAAKIPQRLHGFVNGILREALRQKDTLSMRAHTDKTGQPILNHPQWLLDHWRQNFGEAETVRICQANSVEPLLVLRVNTAVITTEAFGRMLDDHGIAHRPGTYATGAVILPDFHGLIGSLPGYAEGFFQVQDQAAQLATGLLGPFAAGGRYLDGCAGLGGKTCHLLQLGEQHDLQITAVEPEPHRLHKLMENINRLFPGKSPHIFQGNLQQFCTENSPAVFDGILIDAPCSGTGVIGRHPDIRWNRQEEDLPRYRQEQLDLLSYAAPLVKSQGVLVYATCSLEPEENQQVIDDFLQSRSDFSLTDCSPHLPPAARQLLADRFFRPHPAEEIDGFFAARMQRT